MGSIATEALEFEVLRAPRSVKCWLQLVKCTQQVDYAKCVEKANAVNIVYERALRANSYSYKLWMGYILYRREHTREMTSAQEWFRSVRDIYDRAVEKLPMMPLLWTSFIEFVMDEATPPRITLTRHVIIRALRALPLTQHHRVWKLAKQWARRPYVPTATATYLWRLFLLYDQRAVSQRDYFVMLWERASADEFLRECASFLLHDTTPHEELLRDTAFWETIRVALETKCLHFTGDVAQVGQMVQLALEYCASPAEFLISHAVFLASQGEICAARNALWSVLENVDDAKLFRKAFKTALAFEDQIVESIATDPSIQTLDEDTHHDLMEKLCGTAPDAVYHLARLTHEHPLLLNQLQLRSDRRSAVLWLKRIEILQESLCSGRATCEDVAALYQQSIAQCTSGVEVVDVEVAQLYESYACYLWESGQTNEAASVSDEGAWHVNFSSATGNVLLMGLNVEFSLMTGNLEFMGSFLSKLAQMKDTQHSIRARGLGRKAVAEHLAEDARPWLLMVDVAFHQLSVSDDNGERTVGEKRELARVLDIFSTSSGYTAEGACYVACRLWHSGMVNEAFQEYERALVSFTHAPLAMLHILQQYLSCLCLSMGQRLPLHRLRELTQLGLEVGRSSMSVSPVTTVEFLYNCAALEAKLGFSCGAIEIVCGCLELALQQQSENDALLFGLLDTVLEMTFNLHGCVAVRQYCTVLLERPKTLSPQLIQRLALWWAAMEKRTGNTERAYIVMETCCKSQDPSTHHGSVFWNLWEAICGTVAQFEDVHQRKQQTALKFGGGRKEADTSTLTSAAVIASHLVETVAPVK
ncbi:hypothetical protein ERJ75_000764900 [Trypanosoma vivax]|uniref:Pre-mRNA-splicing factor SYF1 n=1 Tax=Trypanosoma vivax (strain Y486) TaxID=1055687 RepID=G0U4Z4_TRYVY|nr:hypothetical protein TRVL_01307 [Trypanosoma vivax]KAH8613934.1 hypothetical protein ERJ75_000764900 [Trypanosoma vivax]CCC52509.1 conserved hypothetical protein [Trypanosoma vivax Y486]